jgi:hypothetical protein
LFSEKDVAGFTKNQEKIPEVVKTTPRFGEGTESAKFRE